ncbi:MAG: dipeptide epimerase [Cytophagales bacterium]
MLHWTIEKLNLYLKHSWSISRGSTDQKTNFYISVTEKGITGIGEVAPNIRYNETPEKILSDFGIILNNDLPIVKDLDKLQNLLNTFKISNSLKCGIEMAYIDFLTKKEKTSVFQMLNLKKPTQISTAFTIPIMNPDEIERFHLKFDLNKFKYLKVKINAETGLEMLEAVNRVAEQTILVDANEAFKKADDVLKLMEATAAFDIALYEQPLPSYLDEEYYFLKENSPYELFADESITSELDFVKIKRQFHGVNMKLMKAGGLVNGAKIIKEAKLYGLKTMVGCMVETTVGIANGMYFAGEVDYVDLDSFLYLENDPSSRIQEEKGILSFKN